MFELSLSSAPDSTILAAKRVSTGSSHYYFFEAGKKKPFARVRDAPQPARRQDGDVVPVASHENRRGDVRCRDQTRELALEKRVAHRTRDAQTSDCFVGTFRDARAGGDEARALGGVRQHVRARHEMRFRMHTTHTSVG